MAAKVIPMKPNKPATASKVKPPEDWSVTSVYGSLCTLSGVELVRLEDIHAEMCKGGKPPKMATYDIFHHFLSESINGHEKGSRALIPQLHVTSAMSYPLVLFRDGVLAKQDHALPFGRLPELGHVHYEDGTTGGVLYTLAEAAQRVWVGGVDPTTDHAEMWRAKKAEAEDRKYGVEWPSNDALRKVLGRLAVCHELAHQLWGWGTVGAAAMDAPQSEVESSVGKVAKSKVPQRELAPEWTGERLAKRQAELRTKCLAQGLRNFTALLAEECGLPIREVTRRIRSVKGSPIGAMAGQLQRKAS